MLAALLLAEFRDLRSRYERDVVTKVKENQARVANWEAEYHDIDDDGDSDVDLESSEDESVDGQDEDWANLGVEESSEDEDSEDSDSVYGKDWANLGVEATQKENEAVKPAEPLFAQLDIQITCLGPCGQRGLPQSAFSNQQLEDALGIFNNMPKDARNGEMKVQRFVSLVCKQCEETVKQKEAAKPAHADAQEVRIEAASTQSFNEAGPVGCSNGIFFGTVAKVVKHKGYAFIRRDDGKPDLFAHFQQLDGNEDWLKEGNRVQFAEMMDQRRQQLKARRWSIVKGGAARGWSNRQQWWR